MSYLASLKKIILHPSEFFSDLSEQEPNTLKALLTLLLSSAVLIGMIFLGEIINSGDLIYTQFHFQTETYIIQQVTTLKHFGFYIASNQYFLLFVDKLFFFVKMWLLFIGALFLTAVMFRSEKGLSLSKTFEVVAWSSSLLLILGGITVAFWGLRFLIPLYYHIAYYFIFVGIIGVLFPIYVIAGLGKSTSISFYKRMILVFSPMILIVILWMVNHTDLLLAHMF